MKKKKIKIGLDLTKLKIEKFNEYIIEKSKVNEELSNEELKKRASNIGLDLTKNLSKRIEL